MYPGLLAEDSLYTIGEIRSGTVTVWFTAWWAFLVKGLTLNTHAISLATLAGVLTFTWAVRAWAAAVLPAGPARAWAVLAISATPLVGAMGIQLRHDTWMTSGLLLWTALIVRTNGMRAPLTLADLATLFAVVLLLPTRHNGMPTVAVAGTIGLWLFHAGRARHAMTLAVVVVSTVAITQAATRAAGQPHAVDPAQTVEWAMADVSCLLTQGVEPTAAEWDVLERMAARVDWPQVGACRFVNPIQFSPSFRFASVEGQVGPMLQTWWSVLKRHPWLMLETHLKRVSLFLPPFLAGMPHADSARSIHSSIFTNGLGIAWRFPRVAGIAQLSIRAWHRGRLLLANAAVWLIALVAIWWVTPDPRRGLAYTIVIATVLLAALVATAPVSEARYGLYVLVCGQLTFVYWLLGLANRPPRLN